MKWLVCFVRLLPDSNEIFKNIFWLFFCMPSANVIPAGHSGSVKRGIPTALRLKKLQAGRVGFFHARNSMRVPVIGFFQGGLCGRARWSFGWVDARYWVKRTDRKSFCREYHDGRGKYRVTWLVTKRHTLTPEIFLHFVVIVVRYT